MTSTFTNTKPFGDRIERLPDFGNVLVRFGVEQRFGSDPERERHHVRVHVTHIARLPVRKHTLSQANHRVGVAGHSSTLCLKWLRNA